MDLLIIVLNWNTRDLLLDCLASVYKTVKDLSFEILVVDNASSDDSVTAVRQRYPDVRLLENEKNLGFAGGMNSGLRQMRGRYALLLSTDTVLTEDAVLRLYNYLENNRQFGLVGGQLLNADGSKQNSIANFPTILSLLLNETLLRIFMPARFPSKRCEYDRPIAVDSCIGACLMVRKDAMEEAGMLDERYFFFFEETDWAQAMRKAGWLSAFVPNARIYHLQGKSAGHNVQARIMFYRSRYTYFKKWFPKIWPLLDLLVLLRLLSNLVLNTLGMLITLGLYPETRGRFWLYLRILFWHIKGCPDA